MNKSNKLVNSSQTVIQFTHLFTLFYFQMYYYIEQANDKIRSGDTTSSHEFYKPDFYLIQAVFLLQDKSRNNFEL